MSPRRPLPSALVTWCRDPRDLPASPAAFASLQAAWATAATTGPWLPLPTVQLAANTLDVSLGADASLSAQTDGTYLLRTSAPTITRATALHEMVHAALDDAPPATIRTVIADVLTTGQRRPALLAHATVGALSSLHTTFGTIDDRASAPLRSLIDDGLAYLRAVNDLGHAYRAHRVRDTIAPREHAARSATRRTAAWIRETTRTPAAPLAQYLEGFAAPRRARWQLAPTDWTATDEGLLIFASEVLAYHLGDRCASAQRAATPGPTRPDTARLVR